MQIFFKCALLLVALLNAGCAKATTSQNSASSSGEWPSYAATDFNKPSQPKLSATQVALIRKTLALTTPCQAARLRYAFPRDEFDNMVLFFQPTGPGEFPHLLWSDDLYYDPTTGRESAYPNDGHPAPKGFGTAYEVQHWSCPGTNIQ